MLLFAPSSRVPRRPTNVLARPSPARRLRPPPLPQLRELEVARRKFLGLAASPPPGPSREERMKMRGERRGSEEPFRVGGLGYGGKATPKGCSCAAHVRIISAIRSRRRREAYQAVGDVSTQTGRRGREGGSRYGNGFLWGKRVRGVLKVAG